MSRKGKKNPPDSRQEEAGSPAAGTRKVPKESLASRGREAAATARSFGPRDWLFAAALVVAGKVPDLAAGAALAAEALDQKRAADVLARLIKTSNAAQSPP